MDTNKGCLECGSPSPLHNQGCKTAEIERLQAALERERTAVADGINSIVEAIKRREWLRLGRGSYEYDDDRWRDEFGAAIDEIYAALNPLRAIAGDLSDCPTSPEKIKAARSGLSHQ